MTPSTPTTDSTESTTAPGPLDVPLGDTWPTPDGFREAARTRRVVPVVRRFLGDGETPVGLYRRLAADRTGSFLLESAEHDGSWARWSIVGVRSSAVLTSTGRGPEDGCWIGTPPAGVPTSGDPLQMLRETLRVLATPRVAGLPPLTSGLVGMLGWDVVHRWERLPWAAEDDLHLPELSLCLATDLAVLDHRDATVWLVANAVNHDGTDARVDEAYAEAVARLEAMTVPSSTVTSASGEEPTTSKRRPPGASSRTRYMYGLGLVRRSARYSDNASTSVSTLNRCDTTTWNTSPSRMACLPSSTMAWNCSRVRVDAGSGASSSAAPTAAEDGVARARSAVIASSRATASA